MSDVAAKVLESPSFRWGIWMMWSRPSFWSTMNIAYRHDVAPIVKYLDKRGMATLQAVRDELALRDAGIDAFLCRGSWKFYHRIGRLASRAGSTLWLALLDEVNQAERRYPYL